MIIISDCLTAKVDEGCLKVANSLTKKIKASNPDTIIVSYDRKPSFSDKHLELNKLFLNKELISLIWKKKDSVLYIPFASNTTASAVRSFILSLFCRKKLNVIFVLGFRMNPVAKLLLRMSKANVIALSKESYGFYTTVVGDRAHYLKTGIDTEKFVPVDKNQKDILKKKYCISADKKVLLHVGHLKGGRNVDKLRDVDSDYHVYLVVSSVTEKEKDAKLRAELENRPNTTIVDTYIENIQEIYQIADVYLFPVQEAENCIDLPLSVLEAAACNIPIVTTPYEELNAFIGKRGFRFIDSCEATVMNQAIKDMASIETVNTRDAVLDYDWQKSIQLLESIVG